MIIRVVPSEGLKLRNPITKQVIPPEGADVELSPYWTRRLRDGDISIQEKEPQVPAKDNK